MAELMRLDEIRRLDRDLEARAASHPDQVLKAGVTSPGLVAVAGRDGFLFIGDGANRWERQYLGEFTIPPSWTEGGRSLLERRQAEAAARGVPLWNFVIPEKQVIYPEQRWGESPPDGDKRPLKHLFAALDRTARLVYPDAALLEAKALAPAYFRRNSHWTASGCCAAVGALVSAMEARLGAGMTFEDVSFAVARNQTHHDLGVHFFATPPTEDFVLLTPAGEVTDDNRMFELTGRHTGSRYVVHNPAAADSRTVILFGDSYGLDMGVTAALSAVFAKVAFVWSKAMEWDLVSQHGAELVV